MRSMHAYMHAFFWSGVLTLADWVILCGSAFMRHVTPACRWHCMRSHMQFLPLEQLLHDQHGTCSVHCSLAIDCLGTQTLCLCTVADSFIFFVFAYHTCAAWQDGTFASTRGFLNSVNDKLRNVMSGKHGQKMSVLLVGTLTGLLLLWYLTR